jgi:hypothetical protein
MANRPVRSLCTGAFTALADKIPEKLTVRGMLRLGKEHLYGALALQNVTYETVNVFFDSVARLHNPGLLELATVVVDEAGDSPEKVLDFSQMLSPSPMTIMMMLRGDQLRYNVIELCSTLDHADQASLNNVRAVLMSDNDLMGDDLPFVEEVVSFFKVCFGRRRGRQPGFCHSTRISSLHISPSLPPQE